MLNSIVIIISSILLSSIAHILLKKGMMTHALKEIKNDNILEVAIAVGTNPWVVTGIILHVGALVVWLLALSKVDISFAYPFLALGYVLVSLMAYYYLGEELSITKIIGMLIIIVGIMVLVKAD